MRMNTSYEKLKDYAKNNGMEALLEYLDNKCGYGLYSLSTGWLDNKKYILKAKGETGDLLVTWK